MAGYDATLSSPLRNKKYSHNFVRKLPPKKVRGGKIEEWGLYYGDTGHLIMNILSPGRVQ